MNIITSSAHFRQRVVKRSLKKGVTNASKYYHISRQAIYKWRKKYDGTWQSLIEKSHRPKHHPNEHTPEEKEMILRRYPRYKDDLIALWDSLRKSGYTRNYYSMVRVIHKWVEPEINVQSKRKPKPYKPADYPGQKVQIDVKFVPTECVSNRKAYYQYTAVDECSRWTFRWMYDEHSTYSSADFLKRVITEFPVPIREIQTDNGTEFTNALLTNNPNKLSLFEELLKKARIIYHRIRVATPQHNGKVERQHREDQKRFYNKLKMYGLSDGLEQLKKYNVKSNNIPKICLGFKTPNEVLQNYMSLM